MLPAYRGFPNAMNFEHFALNVGDARSVSQWYAKNLGLVYARKREEPTFVDFLADDSGQVVVELYSNPDAQIPDYQVVNPRTFLHRIPVAADPRSDKNRLLAAGASFAFEEIAPDGSVFVMLRDPWGIPLQLVRRAQPF